MPLEDASSQPQQNSNPSTTAPVTPPPPVEYQASMASLPPGVPLPAEFVAKVQELEKLLNLEVWLFCTGNLKIDYFMFDMFCKAKSQLPKPEVDPATGRLKSKVALLIHSYGGSGDTAYRIASMLQRKCGGFLAVVPRKAKSAATLLSLGAHTILLGEEADLGPIDAQYEDHDVEEDMVSALDEVQAVESLEKSATETALRVMHYLHKETKKSYNALMKNSMDFAAAMTKPLFEKIDSIRYSRQSRRLQEAQDYAERLLLPRFKPQQAKAIAQDLLRNYPTHGFCIDRKEAQTRVGNDEYDVIGLPIQATVDPRIDLVLDWLYHEIGTIVAIGKLVQSTPTPAGVTK